VWKKYTFERVDFPQERRRVQTAFIMYNYTIAFYNTAIALSEGLTDLTIDRNKDILKKVRLLKLNFEDVDKRLTERSVNTWRISPVGIHHSSFTNTWGLNHIARGL
jgi:hypothetical protein